ncbi:MAG: hypothetical protein KAR14_14695 [Candidatus Aminicenantes bacterium]|nr:hypothetical protein [Candidatus Aminicenantes bacterium]
MDENKDYTEKKNPGLAALISGLFPGSGLFYAGNYTKGFSYMLLFALLIVLLVYSADDGRHSMAADIVVFSLLLAGFYVFQIIDSFNEVKKRNRTSEPVAEEVTSEISLTGSVIILILGVLFMLRNLDVISYRSIIKLWPLLIIGIGLKMVIEYLVVKENEDE